MDIEINEYVRTKELGMILKVDEETVVFNMDNSLYVEDTTKMPFEDKVVNHNKNIIELVEVGDYVNGKLVIATKDIINDKYEKAILTENYDEWTENGIVTNNEIQEILTKEQYEQYAYKVEEQ